MNASTPERNGPMTYEELIQTCRNERSSKVLQKCRGDLYKGMNMVLSELEQDYERAKCASQEPEDLDEVSKRLRWGNIAARNIMLERMTKIFMNAYISSNGGKPENSAFTAEEHRLYDEMRSELIRHKDRCIPCTGGPDYD